MLTGLRPPPAPARTHIYDTMDQLLNHPSWQLARPADDQRKGHLKDELGEEPAPLLQEVRDLVLRNCSPNTERQILIVLQHQPLVEEPGLKGFLDDAPLSGTATPAEVAFLKRLKFKDRRPRPLYYYRELQNLRDPLHFSHRVVRNSEE